MSDGQLGFWDVRNEATVTDAREQVLALLATRSMTYTEIAQSLGYDVRFIYPVVSRMVIAMLLARF